MICYSKLMKEVRYQNSFVQDFEEKHLEIKNVVHDWSNEQIKY